MRLDAKFLQADRFQVTAAITRDTRNDFAQTGTNDGRFAALVAFVCANEFHLCEFAAEGFQPEFKTDGMWFASIGSGQPITDPFLAHLGRVFFDGKRPALNEGIFAAIWALEHAIELNAGGINGPSQIAILTKQHESNGDDLTARLLTDDEIAEHLSSIKGAEAHMRSYREILGGKLSDPSAIAPPSPPAAP